jgi:CheY-like chemotaxis protein
MKRVLLAEDDRFLCRACEATLRQQGFDVVLASDGEKALRLVRETPPPDLVLLDLLLPKVAGIEVLRRIKDDPLTRHIPVVVLSISARETDRRRTIELGAAAFYLKANLSLKQLASDVVRLVRGTTEHP